MKSVHHKFLLCSQSTHDIIKGKVLCRGKHYKLCTQLGQPKQANNTYSWVTCFYMKKHGVNSTLRNSESTQS